MSGNRINSVTDGLPKQFVTSLRILFDILDEDRTGFVSLQDIETRWHDEGVKGLPSGVIDSLRKVAPKNGKLDFDNFVSGLKLSLIKPNANNVNQNNGLSGKAIRHSSNSYPPKVRPSSAPAQNHIQHWNQIDQSTQHVQERQPRQHPLVSNKPNMVHQNMVAVRPNNVVQAQNIELRNQIYQREQMQQASIKKHPKIDQPVTRDHERRPEARPHSVHKSKEANLKSHSQEHVNLRPKNTGLTPHTRQANFNRRSVEYSVGQMERLSTSEIPPGRPERPPPYRPRHESPPMIPPRNVHGPIMNELKNWQREHSHEDKIPKMHVSSSDSNVKEKGRLSGEEIYVNIEQIRKHAASPIKTKPSSSTTNLPQKAGIRRQNSRRHTLSSGVDYNVIRRMKQLEQEKDSLLQGLEVIERTRDWYHKQIALVTEKQNYVEKTSCSDVTLQSNQERMDFVQGRITEVNMNLKSLMESTESNFPAHMNLAVRSPIFSDESRTRWLKDQNKQLTKEVGAKSEIISKLEKEKATLIRDLFEARSKHKTNFDDTTFM